MTELAFTKGHGTENDFVVVADVDGTQDLTTEQVQWLCHRQAGIGADGVLRAVRGRLVDDWQGDPSVWFMDYRNNDGSLAEMCGNGLRVFVRYLVDNGLLDDADRDHNGAVMVGTRAGLRTAQVLPDGQIRLGMGPVQVDPTPRTVALGDRRWQATKVDVGNPHAVAFGDGIDDLDLHRAPTFSSSDFPDGVNVEFVEIVAPGHARMRVFERGVGETRSCGTGTVAVAAAAQRQASQEAQTSWRIDVPGGSVRVELASDQAYLTGPAVLVATGIVTIPDL